MTNHIGHWIGGASFVGSSDRTSPVHNPATGELTGLVNLASLEAIDDAVQCASIAARQWGRSPLSRRAAVLFSFRELLQSRSAELAAIVTAEHGKVLSDAAGEVARGRMPTVFAIT